MIGWLKSLAETRRWSPRRLGRSLPIDRALAVSRGVVAAVAVLGLAAAAAGVAELTRPDAETSLPAAEVERLVTAALARAELPHWVPGEALPAAERPPYLAPPPPPLWRRGDPGRGPLGGRAGGLVAEGIAAYDDGRWVEAATAFLEAADAAPTAWAPRYDAGLALHRAGDGAEARRALGTALVRIEARGGDDPAGHAAAAATRYAAGLATLGADCIEAIRHLKLAVADVGRYRRAGGTRLYRRELPFELVPTGLDSYAVYLLLAQAYLGCEGRYPGEYEARWSQAKGFTDTEYADPDAPEVRQGPFPRQLSACIRAADGERPARCWALSNLNRLYVTGRSLLPAEDTPPTELARRHAVSLTRLAYAVAWLAADDDEDRQGAVALLDQARRVQRLAAEPELADEIAALARHLAPVTGDYSFLAEPYLGKDPSTLRLDATTPPEAVKGIAWAASDRWIGMIRQGHIAPALAAAEAQRARAGPYGESLAEWLEEVRHRFGEALAGEMVTLRDNGNLAAAVALRELEAPYLGEGWNRRAALAWLTPAATAAAVGLLVAALALAAGAWLLHRLVVVPYLVYTSDYYRNEFQRRHAAARDAGRPFTAEEIARHERLG